MKFVSAMSCGVFVLASLLSPESAFAQNTQKPRDSSEGKIDPPTVEDYAAFFAKDQTGKSADKLLAADKLRLQTIISINALLNSPDIENIQKFELLLRLGETYVERHDYLRAMEIDSYSAEFDEWQQAGEQGKTPTLDYEIARKELTKGVNAFRKLVIEYPKHPRTDAALFALAQTMSRLGNDNATMYYKQLLRSHPNSALIPDVHLALGEHFFDRNQLAEAIINYRSAMKFKSHRAYPYAVYKLGWAFFNRGGNSHAEFKENLGKSIAAFKLVIKLADLPRYTKSSINLKDEAINDLVLVWADAEDVASAWVYFETIGRREKFYSLLERLGKIYAEQGKNEKAILVLTRLLDEAPLRETSPQVSAKIVQIHDLLGQIEQVVVDLKKMQQLYIGQTPWTKANSVQSETNSKLVPQVVKEKTLAVNDNSDSDSDSDSDSESESEEGIVKSTHILVELNLHRFGASYHNKAQKSGEVRYRDAAIALYDTYLDTFAATENAYEIRYYLAELLYEAERFETAANHYMFVSNQKNGKKYRQQSALSAVAAMNIRVKAGSFQKLPRRGQVVKPLEIPASKKLLVKSIDNFVAIFPTKIEARAMRYTAADIYFNYGHYDESVKRFATITEVMAKTKQSNSAIGIILAYFTDKNEWVKVIDWSKGFISKKNLMDAKLTSVVKERLRYGLFKYGLALEDQGKKMEAAKLFVDFQREFPKDLSADKALYNASLNYYKIGEVSEALAAGSLILARYPKSSLRPDVMVSIAQTYEAIADFNNAAKFYYDFAREFPKDKRAPGALFNAGMLYKGLAKLGKSHRAFSQVLARYPNHGIEKDVLLEFAEVLDKRKQKREAVENYKKFASKYGNTDVENGFFALAKSAVLMADGVDPKAGKKALQELQTIIGSSNIAARSARRVLAQGLFRRYERQLVAYNRIRVDNGKKVSSQVTTKNAELMRLAAKFQGIISLRNSEFAVASLYRMGQMHETLSNDLFKAPTPVGASQKEIDTFRSQLEEVAFPLREDAYKYYKAAHKRSKEVETFTVWTQKTYDKMVVLEPNTFPVINARSVGPKYLAHKMYLTGETRELTE